MLRTENELRWQGTSLGRHLTSGGTPGKVGSSAPWYLSEHLKQKGGVPGGDEGSGSGQLSFKY